MVSTLTEEKLNILEFEKKQLEEELWQYKNRPEREIAYILLIIGLILSILSIIHQDSISAFIGIATTFWGTLLLYAKKTIYMKKEIFDNSILNLLENLESTLKIINFNGQPYYKVLGTLAAYEDIKIILPISDTTPMPTIEQLLEDRILYDEPRIIKLTPPGINLSKKIEQELNINFSLYDIEYLVDNLEKIFIESLEISQFFTMKYKDCYVYVSMKDTIFDSLIEYVNNQEYIKNIGDPLISSIACILALTTNKIIKLISINNKNKEVDLTYEIIEE